VWSFVICRTGIPVLIYFMGFGILVVNLPVRRCPGDVAPSDDMGLVGNQNLQFYRQIWAPSGNINAVWFVFFVRFNR
jgi:hypothetical protein